MQYIIHLWEVDPFFRVAVVGSFLVSLHTVLEQKKKREQK